MVTKQYYCSVLEYSKLRSRAIVRMSLRLRGAGVPGGVGVPDCDSVRDLIMIPVEGSGVTLLDLEGRLPVAEAALESAGVEAGPTTSSAVLLATFHLVYAQRWIDTAHIPP